MGLTNAIKVSNDDAIRATDPSETFNTYVKLRSQHDSLFEQLVAKINDKFNEDIKNSIKDEQIEIVLDEPKQIKYKIGNGNVFITFSQLRPEKNLTIVTKQVCIQRDSKTEYLAVEVKPEFITENRTSNLLLDLKDLTIKIQQTPLKNVTGTFVDEVKSASDLLSRNIDLLQNYSGNFYDILKEGRKIGGSINKGNDFKKILDQLFVLSVLFN